MENSMTINNILKEFGEKHKLHHVFTPIDVKIDLENNNGAIIFKNKFLFLDSSKGKHSLTLITEYGDNAISDIKFALRIKRRKGVGKLISLDEINKTLSTNFIIKSGDLLYEGAIKRDEINLDVLESLLYIIEDPLIKYLTPEYSGEQN